MNGQRLGTVTSEDGTAVGFRRVGDGPAVILVHGAMQASQHLMRLADALAGDYTVYVPDRRGRGRSGPNGGNGIGPEVEDLRALIDASGARRIFGHSSGALLTLRTALAVPDALDRIAVYEPPLSIQGSVPLDWAGRYAKEIAAGRISAALVTALKGLGTEPLFARVPRCVLVPLLALGMRFERGSGDSVPPSDLVPTMAFDIQAVEETADTAQDYRALDVPVLLLGGTKSPAYLDVALRALTAELPHPRRHSFPGLGHSGPDEGDPDAIGRVLRDFFTEK